METVLEELNRAYAAFCQAVKQSHERYAHARSVSTQERVAVYWEPLQAFRRCQDHTSTVAKTEGMRLVFVNDRAPYSGHFVLVPMQVEPPAAQDEQDLVEQP